MSRGRGRSWRPERKSGGRESRRKTIIFLIVALAVLVGVLIIPTIPPSASFRVALMVPQDATSANTTFSVNRSAAVVRGTKGLELLFQNLRDRNERQVGEVSTVKLLSDISSIAKSGEKLLLYCGLEPIVAYGDAPELQLWDGSETIAFSDLLKKLADLQASQIILVMDYVQRDTGIANGRLSDDAATLIQANVAAANIQELAVIFPCAPGERTWEPLSPQKFYSATDPGDEEAAKSSTASQSAGADDNAGTMLTAALHKAFLEGQYTSLEQLYESIRDHVATAVQSQYGQVQTVQLYPANSRLRQQELLLRTEPPSLNDAAEDESPVDDDTPAGDAKPETSVAGQTKPQVVTPESELNAFLEKRAALAATGEGLATNPVEWTQLTVVLAKARWNLIHGDQNVTHFRVAIGEANKLIQKIEFDLNTVATARSKVSFAPWLTISTVADAAVTPERLGLFVAAFNDLKQDQPTGDLPSELRLPEARAQFADWIVQQVSELSKSLDTQTDLQQQKKALAEWRQFITQLPNHGWSKSDWPEPLFTIDEILGQQIDHDAAEIVHALTKLIRLRQRTLGCAAGTFSNGSRFRQSVWQDVEAGVRQLLIDLTAAERWLALGTDGLAKSQQKLDVADSNWSDVNRRLKSRHAISTLPDLQQTDLPFLIQFLAQQQEEVVITAEELDVALTVADNILTGAEISAGQFSPGIHGGTGLSIDDVQAMFQLTRNLSAVPANEQDLTHLETLNRYLSQRMANGSGGVEAQRLVSMVSTDQSAIRSIADCVAHLQRSPGTIIETTQGRTGLRLSSWSIRLLDAVSGTVNEDLWRLWKTLIEAIRDDDSKDILATRTKLTVALSDAWSEFRSGAGNASASELFVTQKMASGLLADDLVQRIDAKTNNAKIYQRVYENSLTGAPALRPADGQFELAASETQIGADNKASVGLKARAAKMYLSDRALEPDGETFQQLGWYRIEAPGEISELVLSASNAGSESQVLKLVFANEHDVVFASQNLTVHPNAAAAWEVIADSGGRSIVLRDGRDLKLPPSTLTTDGQDAPIPLNIRLRKLEGAARQANVELFAIHIDGRETALGTRLVDFTKSNTVQVPLAAPAPAAGDTVPPVSSAPDAASGTDVHRGIRLDVTPIIKGATTTSITIRPLIADATEYVQLPHPAYDPSSQELSIVVHKKQNVASLSPKTLPLEIHFNPLLAGMLRKEDSSPTKMPKLQDKADPIRFIFSDELRSRFNGFEDLEFSMSVAGIPHAWRWRLEDDGATLLAPDEPAVRTDLSLQNPKELVVLSSGGNLLLGEDWKKAKLDVQMHIHGGQFAGGRQQFKAQHELRLKIARQDSNRNPVTVWGAEDIFTRRPESIRITAGENGAWNFSTQTSSYETLGLRINETSQLGPGKYELIAELTTLDTGRSEKHGQAFTFDATAPVFSERDIRIAETLQAGQPVVGSVTVEDPESEITEIRVGFDKSSMKKVSSGERFTLPAGSKGIPKLQPAPQFQSEVATLIVTAINEADIEKTITKDVSFVRNAMNALALKPKATGSVEFKYDSTLSWTAMLKRGSETIKTQTAGSPMLFDDVPVGTYTIFWKTGVGAKSDTTPAFSVKNGVTSFITPDGETKEATP